MELAPLRIAEAARRREQHADRLERGERAGPAGHRAEHAVFGARVAVVGVEGVADVAAVAWLARQVPGEGADLPLEATDRRAEQRDAGGDAGIGDYKAGGKRVGTIDHQVGTAHNVAMLIVYVPSAKAIIEADGWNTEALTALKLQWSNPYIVNLNDNIQRYHLDVATIIPLHGPRTGTLAELQELAKLPVMPKS